MMTWDQKQKKRWTAKGSEEYFGGDGNVCTFIVVVIFMDVYICQTHQIVYFK